ncbi:MAG: hypothetical protein A2583_03725 [Bdellovibrionales bacterium RIFOXYD1_FULL_53_11]|nr:MAG: hypothetical protein A2583_03725 [Bdellovibrionales bacterium RIFOXYD1_FULL_53_11]
MSASSRTLDYFRAQTILIVDTAQGSRQHLLGCLNRMEVPMAQVHDCDSHDEAVSLIKSFRPTVLMCEYMIGKRYSFELFDQQRGITGGMESFSVVITGNHSQMAVARAAEEDVDCFVIKPFSPESLVAVFDEAIKMKFTPNDYKKLVDSAALAIGVGRPADALKILEKAVGLHQHPALAHYYIAQAHEKLGNDNDARFHYLLGLESNNVHYRCLRDLCRLLVNQREFAQAYEVAKSLIRHYPANPDHLEMVLRLAILNKRFEDIENCYNLLMEYEDSREQFQKQLASGLMTAARHYFSNNLSERAGVLLQKAVSLDFCNTYFLLKAIELLYEYSQVDAAREILGCFPTGTEGSLHHEAARFLIDDLAQNPEKTLARGKLLIDAGHHWPLCYHVLIRRYQQLGKQKEASWLAAKALQKFPDDSGMFEGLAS